MRPVFMQCCCALAALLCASICAQEIRYAAELNHVPVECRAVAMGNAGVVLPRNGSSAFWNPALPSLSRSYEVSLEGAKLYSNLADLGVVSFCAPVQNEINLGAIYTGFFSGDILEQDSLEGTPLERLYNPELRANGQDSKGTFRNNQHRVQVSLARLFEVPIPRPSGFSLPLPVDLGGGVNFKYYWQTMTPGDEVRMGFNLNLDVGLVLRIGADFDLEKQEITRQILIAAAITDVLPTKVMWLYSESDYREPVHRIQNYGVSYTDKSGLFFGNWTLALALRRQYETTVHAGIEGEFWDLVAFRAGISDRTAVVGAGVHTDIFSIDYAFSFDELDFSPLRLAVGFSF